ncbi:MAG: hypothetical protein B7C24_10600 [Bacteroidetes bacterium 4572_77]|nr:MAG: hypothetical protein B7C24_10600 [Bacteroidetes bacterium 4572_77]
MARHPKSQYIEGSLFLMAKTFFYKEEWLPAQLKCGELIDKFPAGELSPDAHLLLAKTLIIQNKLNEGIIILSRTVDIAWQLERYDILSEAFRIEAELYLHKKDYVRAFRPYKQAIIQTNDCEQRAKWQLDLAALLYKVAMFDKALIAFREVEKYCPDYVRGYEAKLYEANCLARLGQYQKSEKILKKLERDGKYEEWQEYTYNGILNRCRLMLVDSTEKAISNDSLVALESHVDTTFTNSAAIGAYYFERAMDYYKVHDLRTAREYFSKGKVAKSPVVFQSDLMHKLLNRLDRKTRIAEHSSTSGDTTTAELLGVSPEQKIAADLYEVGRVYETLQQIDSSLHYYHQALEQAPKDDPETGKYYLTYSERVRERDPYMADSLLEELVEHYTYTPYGEAAMKKLNFVVSLAIDTAGELYESGYKLYKHKNYRFAVLQFDSLYRTFPHSDFAPKSLYTAGYIYEQDFQQYDSALYYYRLLVEGYPESEYAKEITYSIDFKDVTDNGEDIPDSLKALQITQYVKPTFEAPVFDPNLNPAKSNTPAGELNPMEVIKNPKSLFNKAKDMLKSPMQQLKDLRNKSKEIIDDPSSSIKDYNPMNKVDSLKNKLNDIKNSGEEEKEEEKEEESKEEEKTKPDQGNKEEEENENGSS